MVSASTSRNFEDIFIDSYGESDFEGFQMNVANAGESDIDFDDLESEVSEDEDQEEDAEDGNDRWQWSDDLQDFHIEPFTAPSGPTFEVGESSQALFFFHNCLAIQ